MESAWKVCCLRLEKKAERGRLVELPVMGTVCTFKVTSVSLGHLKRAGHTYRLDPFSICGIL